MSKPRKTVEIDILLNYANGYLSADWQGGDAEPEKCRRQGLIDMLEAALHSVGRTRGYVYLDQTQITKSKPGIRWLDGQAPSHTFHETDPTRRRYA